VMVQNAEMAATATTGVTHSIPSPLGHRCHRRVWQLRQHPQLLSGSGSWLHPWSRGEAGVLHATSPGGITACSGKLKGCSCLRTCVAMRRGRCPSPIHCVAQRMTEIVYASDKYIKGLATARPLGNDMYLARATGGNIRHGIPEADAISIRGAAWDAATTPGPNRDEVIRMKQEMQTSMK
jgi:hypothetical protein